MSEAKGKYEWAVLSVTTVGVLMGSIQSSALLIVLPEMMSGLGMDMLAIMWVLLIYMLMTTVLVPLFGRLADMFGRKRLYVIGFAVFTVGSLLCGLASPGFHGGDLIIYRMIQSAGGALLIANSGAMIADAFDSRRLGFALGVNMVAAGAGIALGPLVGGALAGFGWEWIFLVNVPIGVFGTAWAWHRLREPVQLPKGQSFDWIGAVVFTSGLVMVLLALSFIAFPAVERAMVVGLMTGGTALVMAFLWWQTKARHPMMDLTLFRNRDFALGNLCMFLNSLSRGAVLFLMVFFLQGPYGMDPLTAGLSLIPFGLSFVIVGPLSGRASDRAGPWGFILAGLIISALGLVGLALIDHSTPFWVLAALMAMAGIGGGLFASPNSSMVMRTVRPEKRGIASGTRSMLVNIGSMFSLALAFPIVLAGLSEEDVMVIFLYGGDNGGPAITGAALALFESGLRTAFLVFLAISALAVAISGWQYLRDRSGR